MKNNLKQEYVLRGLISEVIAKSKLKAFRTKEITFSTFCKWNQFRQLPQVKKDFLKEYWNSIDLYKTIWDKNFKFVIGSVIYEIKGIDSKKTFKPDLTQKSANAYLKAIKNGFIVKIVTVKFYENWEYTWSVTDFELNKFKINNGGKYPKPLNQKRL